MSLDLSNPRCETRVLWVVPRSCSEPRQNKQGRVWPDGIRGICSQHCRFKDLSKVPTLLCPERHCFETVLDRHEPKPNWQNDSDRLRGKSKTKKKPTDSPASVLVQGESAATQPHIRPPFAEFFFFFLFSDFLFPIFFFVFNFLSLTTTLSIRPGRRHPRSSIQSQFSLKVSIK